MRWRATLRGVILALSVVCGAGLARGEEQTLLGSGPVQLEAERLDIDRERGLYQAFGGVKLSQGGTVLLTDELRWETRENLAGATGEVTVTDSQGTLQGEGLLIDLNRKTARLGKAKASLASQGFHLAGEEIERIGDKSYHVRSGTFTACTGERPAWKFSAERLDVDIGGYARARKVIFYLYDTPVLYLPYFLYPVKTERESGFLLPSAGYSQRRGAELSLVYYQVLARNQDATLYLDLLGHSGLGSGAEYRYLFGDDDEGRLHLYRVDGYGGEPGGFATNWRHLGMLPGEVLLRADVSRVSRRDFFADFGEAADEYNREVLESTGYLGRSWGKVSAALHGRYLYDLERVDRTTLQRLPEARLALAPYRLGDSPYYLSLETAGERLWRQDGGGGELYRLRPALRGVWRGAAGTLEGEVGYRHYLVVEDGNQDDQGWFDGTARLTTRLSRVFARADGTVLRHVVEPQLSFHHTPDVNQHRLPQLAPDAVVLPETRFAVALINRLTLREPDEAGHNRYRELLWLRLSSGYDVAADRHGVPWPVLPLRLEGVGTLGERVALRGDYRYDPTEAGGWQSFSGGVTLRDARHNELTLATVHRNGEVGYLEGGLGLPLTPALRLDYRSRYAARGDRFLEHLAEIGWRSQCWGIKLSLRERLADREVMINFSLSGLGGEGSRAGLGGG